jgi:uncharacterized protein (TIGR01244 family)
MRATNKIVFSTVIVMLIAIAVPAVHAFRNTLIGLVSEQKLYVCPPCGCSHDDETHKEPGPCPVCNMAMVEKTDELRELKHIPAFLRLNDKVWTGGQPTMDHLSKLKDEGIKVIVNLRPHSEHKGEREEAKAKELALRYVNIPVAYSAPKDEDADLFLKLTDEQLPNGPVFIHCAAAIRVGAFWMIRRALRDGWTTEQALEEANKIGLRNRPHLTEFARSYIERHRRK